LWKVEEELANVRHQIEAQPAEQSGGGSALRDLLARKNELGQRREELRNLSVAGGHAESR
jgi:hypothetical protein